METTSCFSYFYGDVIGCCSTLLLCVFYNWLCLVRSPANNTLPFCSSLGMAKLYQQRPFWTRLQTNVKVCDVVFSFHHHLCLLWFWLRMIKEISQTALKDIKHISVREKYHFYVFHKIGRHPVCEFCLNLKSFNSYQVMSGNKTARLLKAASQLVLF